MKTQKKTNVMRILDQHKLVYQHHAYDPNVVDGVRVARLQNQELHRVFKTLVTQGKSHQYYGIMIPVDKELDLKKAANAVDEKAVQMIPQKELLPLTGYVHGGCSPLGMKKQFQTVIDASAQDLATIIFSAGKVGYQVELNVEALRPALEFTSQDLTI